MFTPKDNKIIPPEPITIEEEKQNLLSKTLNPGFKLLFKEKTFDRIFSPIKKGEKINYEKEKKIRRNVKAYRDCIGKMFEEQGKISKIPKVTEKPCNTDFQVFSKEAKNNLSDRYYYEINKNQW